VLIFPKNERRNEHDNKRGEGEEEEKNVIGHDVLINASRDACSDFSRLLFVDQVIATRYESFEDESKHFDM
jgi:hypothetical protein